MAGLARTAPAVNEVRTWRPPEALAPFVDGYVGYRTEGGAPALHRGLPSRHLTFIVALGPAVDIVALPAPGFRPTSFDGFVAGLHAAPALIRHDGTQHGIQLRLTPLGARALFRLPAGVLSSAVVDLGTLLGRDAERLREQLASEPSWEERFRLLDGALGRLAGRNDAGPAIDRPLQGAWALLARSHGARSVTEVAAEVGWGRRHLSERFRAEFGLPPKLAAKVMRFERTRTLLQHPERPPLATIAARCGYFDQAHLTRDWHQLAGCSPTTWLGEELPFVQDTEPLASTG